MSEKSELAVQLIERGDLNEARKIVFRAAREAPNDFHTHYAVGLYLRSVGDFEQACRAQENANRLQPRNPWTLLALAIARQKMDNLDGSVSALKECLDADPNFVLGFNTLGMTQKLMGDYDKAAHNYDAGAFTLAKNIAFSLRNDASTQRFTLGGSRNDLWVDYAVRAALSLTAEAAGIDVAAFPNSDVAQRDMDPSEFQGLFWQDGLAQDQKVSRLFLPNFFNALFASLKADGMYSVLMGNRSTVLELLGRQEESHTCLEEAEDFQLT